MIPVDDNGSAGPKVKTAYEPHRVPVFQISQRTMSDTLESIISDLSSSTKFSIAEDDRPIQFPMRRCSQITWDIMIESGDGDSTPAPKFVQAESDHPLSLPLRRLSVSTRSGPSHHSRYDSLDSLNSLSASARFATSDCGQPLHAPSHLMSHSVFGASMIDDSFRSFTLPDISEEPVKNKDSDLGATVHAGNIAKGKHQRNGSNQYIPIHSVDSLTSFLYASARFATSDCGQPLKAPSHLMSQSVVGARMIDESLRSFTLPEIMEETGKRQRIFSPGDCNLGATLHTSNAKNGSKQEESLRATMKNTQKFSVLEGDDEPLHLPMRRVSQPIQHSLREDSHGLAMSTRFAMAEFEEPLHVPYRQLSQSIRTAGSSSNGCSLESSDDLDGSLQPRFKGPISSKDMFGVSGISDDSFLSGIASFES